MELPAPPPPLTIEAVQQELVATSIGESGIRLSQEDASQDPELEPIEPERQYEREAEDNEKAAPLVTDDDADWVLINRSDRDRLWYRVPRDVIMLIFALLSPKDLSRLARVDQRTRHFAESDALSSSYRWAPLAQQRWPKGFLPSGKVTNWKQVYIERAVKELGGHTIRINLDSGDVKCAVAGQFLTGVVYVHLTTPIHIRGLFLLFEGHENVLEVKRGQSYKDTYFSFNLTAHGHFPYSERSKEDIALAAGPHCFPFKVPVQTRRGPPTNLAFPYSMSYPTNSNLPLVTYRLTARLVCVGLFNPDLVATIPIRFVPIKFGNDWFASSPQVDRDWSSTTLQGTQDQQVRLRFTFPRKRWRAGENIQMVVTVWNSSAFPTQTLSVSLVTTCTTVQGARPICEFEHPVKAYTCVVPPRSYNAVPAPLVFTLPSPLGPMITGTYFRLTHSIRARLRMGNTQTSLPFIYIPIEIYDGVPPPPQPGPPKAAAAPAAKAKPGGKAAPLAPIGGKPQAPQAPQAAPQAAPPVAKAKAKGKGKGKAKGKAKAKAKAAAAAPAAAPALAAKAPAPASGQAASPVAKPPAQVAPSPVVKPPVQAASSPVAKPQAQASTAPVAKQLAQAAPSPVAKPAPPAAQPPSQAAPSPVAKPPASTPASSSAVAQPAQVAPAPAAKAPVQNAPAGPAPVPVVAPQNAPVINPAPQQAAPPPPQRAPSEEND